MAHQSLSSWKRPRTGLLILCVSFALALAACGSSTAGSDQTGGTATATSGGSGSTPTATTTGSGGSPTATPSGSGTPDAVAPPFFFTVRATASNSTSDYTVIDNVVSNNDPNLALFVTANWNPNGSGGVYDNHSLGVFYIGSPPTSGPSTTMTSRPTRSTPATMSGCARRRSRARSSGAPTPRIARGTTRSLTTLPRMATRRHHSGDAQLESWWGR